MIYCQACQTPNPPDQDVCRKCGAKLLVIASNQQWEDQEFNRVSLEDHLLERISNLEDTLNNVLDHLTRLAESMQTLDRNTFIARSGLSALIETLKEAGVVQEEPLHQRWESTIIEQMEEARFRDRFSQMKNRFLALFRGKKEKFSVFKSRIDEAEFLILSDRFEESVKPLKKAFAIDKKNYELAFYLAELAHEQGLTKEASTYLNQALAANPNHEDALVMLALIYYGEEHIEEAKELLVRAIKTSPKDDLPLLCLGSIYTSEGLFEEARDLLIHANQIKEQAQTHYLLGIGYREQEKLNASIEHFDAAQSLDPEHEEAIFSLGLAYLAKGWTRKARECFNRALELNPNRMEFRQAMEFKYPDMAQASSELDADSQEVFQFAEQLIKEGKYQQALPHYRALMRKYPNNYLVLTSYSVANFTLRRFEEAQKSAAKILTLAAPPLVQCGAYTLQMEAFRALGQYDEALQLLNQMINHFDDGYGRVIAEYGMALTMADMGKDLREAEVFAKSAVDHSPSEFKHNSLDALGWVYFKQGRYEESLKLLEASVALEENLTHLYHYGMVLLALNLQEKAFQVFDRAVKIREEGPKIDDFIFSAIRREMRRADAIIQED